MERLLSTPIDVHTVSPLSLAYVGDGVYELMVREHLLLLPGRSCRRRQAVTEEERRDLTDGMQHRRKRTDQRFLL